MTSLKTRVGLGTILEDIPKHLPLVQGTFALSDLIYVHLMQFPMDQTNLICLLTEIQQMLKIWIERIYLELYNRTRFTRWIAVL